MPKPATTKPKPGYLRALGANDPPAVLSVEGREFRWVRTFKHDFFAATAMYEADGHRLLLKAGRSRSLFFLPMSWLGRWLTRRESAMIRHFEDLDGVPKFVAFHGSTAFIREFVDGAPMRKGRPVPDGFHQRLRELVAAIHGRGAAYVDLEKCENVIVGDDGKPCLCDFQIAWYAPDHWPIYAAPLKWLRRRLQAGDRYHLAKLQRRTRPDELTEAELAATYVRPWWVRAHAVLARPFTRLRRLVLNRLDPREGRGERGRVPDDGAAPIKKGA